MKIDLGTWANITQIISVVVLLPMGVWKVWKSINDRLTAQDDRLIRIESQFHRNGGSTLRDSIDRIDRDVAKLTGRFDQHIEERTR
jgi:hypothetical protein